MTAVTVVGAGGMGAAVAERLLATGHTVTLRLRGETEASRRLTRAGALTNSDQAAPLDTAIVLDCLPDDAAVCEVFTPKRIAAMPAGAVHVAMATIGVALSDELAALHRGAGSLYLAAPILGRPEAALAGDLQVLAAGDAAALAAARSVLAALGTVRVLDGPASTAHLVKLAVNLNLLHAVQALGASIGLVEHGGVDASTFVDVLTNAAYTGTVHRGYGARIAERRYLPAGFSAANALKDLDLALAAASGLGVGLDSAELRRLLAAEAAGEAGADPAGLDWSALAERYRPAQPK